MDYNTVTHPLPLSGFFSEGLTTVTYPNLADRSPAPDCRKFNFIYDFIIIGTLCILGIVGNTVSIIVLQKDHFNKVTVFLLQALAVADNLVLVMSFIALSVVYGLIPYINPDLLSQRVFPIIIKYVHPFAYVSQCCTVWITVLLAIYRYIAICKPFKVTKWCTMLRARIQVAIIVIVTTLYNIPRLFQYEIIERVSVANATNQTHVNYYIRETNIGERTLFGKIYTNILYTILALVIPLVLLVIMNSKLIKEIRTVRKRARLTGQPKFEEDNITLIMVVIIVVVLVCNTPDRILQVTKDFTSQSNLNCGTLYFIFMNVCNLLIIINSSVNFIVYYLLRRGFRQILFQRLCSGFGAPMKGKSNNDSSIHERMDLETKTHRVDSMPTFQTVLSANGEVALYSGQSRQSF